MEIILLVVLYCYPDVKVYVGNRLCVEAYVVNVYVGYLFSLSLFPLEIAVFHST